MGIRQKLASDIDQAAVDKLLNAGLQESEGTSTGVDLHMPIIPMPEISRPPLIFEDRGFARPEQQGQSIDKDTIKALGLAAGAGAGGIGLAKLLRAYLRKQKLASDINAMTKIKLSNDSNEYISLMAKLLSGRVPTSETTKTQVNSGPVETKTKHYDEPLANILPELNPANMLLKNL